jgi:wobble nucleotide-excising tRNase
LLEIKNKIEDLEYNIEVNTTNINKRKREIEKLESDIKDKLNKKRSVKKYRPILESFSGYSECFDYSGLDDIINIFDLISKNG